MTKKSAKYIVLYNWGYYYSQVNRGIVCQRFTFQAAMWVGSPLSHHLSATHKHTRLELTHSFALIRTLPADQRWLSLLTPPRQLPSHLASREYEPVLLRGCRGNVTSLTRVNSAMYTRPMCCVALPLICSVKMWCACDGLTVWLASKSLTSCVLGSLVWSCDHSTITFS